MAKQKIKKRPDGRYVMSVTVDGERRFVYGATIAECEEKKAELKERARQGLLLKNGNVTLSGYYSEWQARRAGQVKKSTQYANDRRFIRIGKQIGSKKLNDITRPDVYMLQAELKKDLSSTGVNNTISLLRQILESAVNDRVIPYNLTKGVKSVKKTEQEREKNTHRYLSAEEIETFFRYAKDSIYYNLFSFLLFTGMRCGEAGALTWGDVDTESGVIHITKTVTRTDDKTFEIGSTKTSDSKRDIELTPEVKAVLDKQRQQQAALFGIQSVKEQEPIFTTLHGGIITQSNTCPTVANICRKAAAAGDPVEYFTLHAFRHTFITYELEKGVPLNDIARQVGHSNTLTLQKYYSHEDPEKVKAAFRMISEDMGKIVKIS